MFKIQRPVHSYGEMYDKYPNPEEGWIVNIVGGFEIIDTFIYTGGDWMPLYNHNLRKVTVYTTNPMIKDGDFI